MNSCHLSNKHNRISIVHSCYHSSQIDIKYSHVRVICSTVFKWTFRQCWRLKGVEALLLQTYYLWLWNSSLISIAMRYCQPVPLSPSNHGHVRWLFYDILRSFTLFTCPFFFFFWLAYKKECLCQLSIWTAIREATLLTVGVYNYLDFCFANFQEVCLQNVSACPLRSSLNFLAPVPDKDHKKQQTQSLKHQKPVGNV